MSRARHHASKKHHERKHHADGGESRVGNPHVFAEVGKHTIGTIQGEHSKKRLDRKHGGKVGSDTHPYTSAHKRGGAAKHEGGSSHHHGLHGAEKKHHGPHAGKHH